MMDTNNNRENTTDRSDTAVSVLEAGAAGLSTLLHTGMGVSSSFVKDIFITKQTIVGARFRGGSDRLMEDLDPGSRVTFLREPDNHFDHRAVMALDEKGRQIGYIPRSDNRLMSALMDAGKRFYGIVCIDPATSDPGGRGTPSQIWVDLYMQEFSTPGEMTDIPRQESDGSYVVMYYNVYDKGDLLDTVYAIRVINGEERGSFAGNFPSDPAEETQYRKQVEDLHSFIGRLPIVCYAASGSRLRALENAWGLMLGLPLSNHLIDLKTMADNHVYSGSDFSLEELGELLGIEAKGSSREERLCRIMLDSYHKMDKPEIRRDGRSAEERLKEKEVSEKKKEIRDKLNLELITYLFGAASAKMDENDWPTAVTAMEMAVDHGFNGNYSGIGTMYLAGGNGLEKDMETGFLWQKRFYDDYKAGKLELSDTGSLINVCSNLAAWELWKLQEEAGSADEIDDEDLEVPLNLWKEAVDIAAEQKDPTASASSADLLMGIGCGFYYGELHTEDHEEVLITGDSKYAKKALREAIRRGNQDAKEVLQEILEIEPE